MSVVVEAEAEACCTDRMLLGRRWHAEVVFQAVAGVHWHICQWVSGRCNQRWCVHTVMRVVAVRLQPPQLLRPSQKWLVGELVD